MKDLSCFSKKREKTNLFLNVVILLWLWTCVNLFLKGPGPHPHPPMEALESEPMTTPPLKVAARMVVWGRTERRLHEPAHWCKYTQHKPLLGFSDCEGRFEITPEREHEQLSREKCAPCQRALFASTCCSGATCVGYRSFLIQQTFVSHPKSIPEYRRPLTHPCADSFDLCVRVVFLHFYPKIESKWGEVTPGTATSGAPRRAKTHRAGPMALSNVMETPAAGFNFDNAARYGFLLNFGASECKNNHGKLSACRV